MDFSTDISSDVLADRLSHQLIERVSGPSALSGLSSRGAVSLTRSCAPSLAYGRHRGPAPRNSRIAAVAVALFQHETLGWVIPLTLRPASLVHHGGQVCLPGGQAEHGESMLQAATREYTEELGVSPRIKSVCGELPTHYVYASGNQVHPVVMIVDRPLSDWQPDPAEVAEVILLPLSVLADRVLRVETVQQRQVHNHRGKKVGEIQFQAPAYEVERHLVWGATAMMLDHLAHLLH